MRRPALAALAVTAVLATLHLPCRPALGQPPSPVKLAVFDFELADFSAGGPLAGESAAETERLKLITGEAKRLLAESGRYQIIETGGAESEQMRSHWLRNCNGCEADIAAKLGAEQSLLGIMQKLSVLVHTLRFEIRDTKTGNLIWNIQTDLRGDTNESWRRSLRYLVKHRLLATREGN